MLKIEKYIDEEWISPRELIQGDIFVLDTAANGSVWIAGCAHESSIHIQVLGFADHEYSSSIYNGRKAELTTDAFANDVHYPRSGTNISFDRLVRRVITNHTWDKNKISVEKEEPAKKACRFALVIEE